MRALGHSRREGGGVRIEARLGRFVQPFEVLVAEGAERAHEAAVDLGLAERTVEGGHDGRSQVEGVLGELHREERAFVLLELGQGR